jgi:hypothetical protein
MQAAVPANFGLIPVPEVAYREWPWRQMWSERGLRPLTQIAFGVRVREKRETGNRSLNTIRTRRINLES